MQRRWAGMVVIGIVLVAVPIVGRLLGPGEPGTAVAAPPPAPPAVGDCLTVRSQAVPFWWQDGEDVPAADLGPCTGPRFAEVVAVLPTGRDFESSVQDCWDDTQVFVGLPVVDRSGPEPRWSAPSAPLPLIAGPGPWQRAGGQTWLACLAAPGWQVMEPTMTDDEVAYVGTLRDAVTTGTHRDLFAACFHGDSVTATVGSCTVPHDLEVLGYGFAELGIPDRSTVEESCRAHVTLLTGLADPTADGLLVPEVTATTEDGFPLGALDPIPAQTGLECRLRVVGENLLVGSLLGLGDRPIPWAH